MEDAGKSEGRDSVPPSEAPSIPVLDSWIDSLMSCKQLSEADVTKLCDKVRFPACFSYQATGTQARY